MERLEMSKRERDRIRVLEGLLNGQLERSEAVLRLGVGERQARRIVRRYREEGDAGLVHRGRGRASNRRYAADLQEQVLEFLRGRYAGLGPTLAAEYLASEEDLVVNHETLRQWMLTAGLWERQRKGHRHRSRRPRRAQLGSLVQMDTSVHDWLEGRGPECVLITLIDDATSWKWSRFFPADTALANLEMILWWVRQWGRPEQLYTDFASHFKQPPKWVGHKLQQSYSQIERALDQLNIQLLCAHSPQAKGRVERSHSTDQDRLIKGLRLADMNTLEAANQYLEQCYLPWWNERLSCPAADPQDGHRSSAGYDLESILSLWQTRKVQRDYTVRFRGQSWQLEPCEQTPGLAQARIIVEERVDGSLAMRWQERYLRFHLAANEPGTERAAGVAAVVGLRPPVAATPADPKPKAKPGPDHPWRRTFLSCVKADISKLR